MSPGSGVSSQQRPAATGMLTSSIAGFPWRVEHVIAAAARARVPAYGPRYGMRGIPGLGECAQVLAAVKQSALEGRRVSGPAETTCSGFVCKQPAVAVDLERGIYLGEELPEQNLV
jgi:hypothetical protein